VRVVSFVNERVEYEVANTTGLTLEVLQEIELWSPGIIQSNDLAIDDGSGWNLAQRFNDVWELMVQRPAVAGVKLDGCPGPHRESAIPVEFDLISQLGPSGSEETCKHSIGSIKEAARVGNLASRLIGFFGIWPGNKIGGSLASDSGIRA
jgi:hypothetical protein